MPWDKPRITLFVGRSSLGGDKAILGSHFLANALASGGDARIRVRPGDNTNMYGSSPYPRSTLGYASSTANDISADAFAHLERAIASWPSGFLLDVHSYRDRLDQARARLKAVWKLPPSTDVVFAPSGTDLEYVALALAHARCSKVTNVLLGKDEVGSGCVNSAAGRYFATETAVTDRTERGAVVEGFEDVELRDLPIRGEHAQPLTSAMIASRIEALVGEETRRGRHPLVHVVYGSKTGLVLPALGDLEHLVARFGAIATFVVDACQVRIEGSQLRRLLELGCIVMLTGSKFIGGPSFSGFALVPQGLRPHSPLPPGLATIFRRAEWPASWTGCGFLPDSANPGLLLRIEAALFEVERFAMVAKPKRDGVIATFGRAVRNLSEALGAGLVSPCLEAADLHVSTLATLDLSPLPSSPGFAVARRWHRVLAARGLRLGQPVKCVRLPNGEWSGTLRLSLSMPLICELAALDPAALTDRFETDMQRIAYVIKAAHGSLAA